MSILAPSPPRVAPSDYRTTQGMLEPVDASGRAVWLDAFRGFVMLCLISRGFGVPRLKAYEWAAPIVRQFDHVPWRGMAAWDLIQPLFMFIVGLAMPYAFAKRWAAGETWGRSLWHVVKRCGLLVLWAHVAGATNEGHPVLSFINVLPQIAFTYFVASLVLRWPWPAQVTAAVALLAGHTALFMLWRPPGVTGAWAQDANVGWYLDRLILHKNWSGSYATINCVSSAANTIAGVVAGEWLRSSKASFSRKAAVLAAVGVGLIVVGLAASPWVPVIKRIWTASFALVSTGCALLALLGFYAAGREWPNFRWGLFVVVGANSIFLYLTSQIFGGHLRRCAQAFTGWLVERSPVLGGFVTDWLVLGVMVAVAYWLYRRRVFIKL